MRKPALAGQVGESMLKAGARQESGRVSGTQHTSARRKKLGKKAFLSRARLFNQSPHNIDTFAD